MRHFVTTTLDFPHRLRLAERLFPDEKKGRPSPVTIEQIEQARRIAFIGPVVDGEPNFAARGGKAHVGRAEALG